MQDREAAGAWPEATPTSLDLYADTVVEDRCPKGRFDLVSESSGVIVPTSCRSYQCPFCGPRKARRLAMAATWALEPEQVERGRFITLTLPPDRWAIEWKELRQKVRDFKRYMKRRGYEFEWFWTVERGSENGALHLHALAHGDYLPQALVQEVWGGIAYLEGIRQQDRVSKYVMKQAAHVAGYSLKEASKGTYEHHLDLNGSRVAHWSRGFFHGRKLDQAFAEASTGGDEGPWVLVPATTRAK